VTAQPFMLMCHTAPGRGRAVADVGSSRFRDAVGMFQIQEYVFP